MQSTGTIGHADRTAYKAVDRIKRLLEQGRESYLHDVRRTISLVEEALKLARANDQRRYVAVCYEKLGLCYRSMQDIPRARHYLGMALARFEELSGESVAIAAIHYNLGAIDDYEGNSHSALTHYRVVLDQGERGGAMEWTAAALSAMGDTYRQLGDYKAAVGALMRSLDVWERIDNPQGMAVAYQNIAIIYIRLGDWEEAFEALTESLELYRRCGHRRGEALVLANIGNYYVQREEFARGLEYLSLALELDRELGLVQQEVDTLISIAAAYGRQRRLEEALECGLLALEKLDGTRFTSLRPVVLEALGDLYLQMERFEEALDRAMEGLATAVALGNREAERGLCRLIAVAHENLARPEQALEYYKRYLGLHEELTDQETRRAVVSIRTRADAEKADRERQEYRVRVMRLEQEIAHKTTELTTLSLRLTRKDELLRRLSKQVESCAQSDGDGANALSGLLAAIQESKIDEAGWEAFERRLREFQPEFLHTLSVRHPSLTPMELKVCALLKMNMSSKDVSSILNIALYTVNTHRRNIRMKLELPSGVNLTTWLTML